MSNLLTGKENIYLGIRPYGFHAGNELPFLIYPWLLCEALQKKGKIPKFKFYLFLNDYEQYQSDGPDLEKYPFNIYPLDTTIQYTVNPNNKKQKIVEYWQPFIENEVKNFLKEFDQIKIIPVRNSQMKLFPEMKKVILKTINNPYITANVLLKYTKKEILRFPLQYAMAVCPLCKNARGKSKVKYKDIIRHFCERCFTVSEGKYKEFDYWVYYKPLALPRIKTYNIDLCITGLDHYYKNDHLIRSRLFKEYNITVKSPLYLYTELVHDAKSGMMMSKSRKNYRFINPHKLLKIIKNSDKNTITV